MKIAKLVFLIREFFFPRFCALCGDALLGREEAWYGLCQDCRESLDGPGEHGSPERPLERCSVCGRPLISEKDTCLSCRNNEGRSCDRITVVYPYTGRYRKLLGAYKFGKNPALGHFLEEKLREALCCLTAQGTTVDSSSPAADTVLCPVPPRSGKLRKTGWDQVEYLAKLLEQDKLPVFRCLKRLPSRSQKTLGREQRLTNLKGRFITVKKIPKAVILFDDVITTGATLEACAAALKDAGAEKVYGIALFYD
ncbi:amidophosphoribosyltransferase [Spirochaetia bacterium]|nr:amidophosphoribosyltransferase [Spirochaetia bacterium]